MRRFFTFILLPLIFGITAFTAKAEAKVEANAENPNTIVLYSHHPENTPSFKWLNRVYQDLFSRIDFNVEVKFMPSGRATLEAEKGLIEGQFGRIYSYQSLYPSQRRVNVPIYKMTIEAYALSDKQISLTNGWQSFEGTSHLVEYKRGVVVSQQNLEKYVTKDNLSTVTSTYQGFSKLTHHRSDIFIFSKAGSFPYLQSAEFKNQIKSVGTMAQNNLYLYVHEKYAFIIPALESAIKDMQANDIIYQHCLAAYQQSGKEICTLLKPSNSLHNKKMSL